MQRRDDDDEDRGFAAEADPEAAAQAAASAGLRYVTDAMPGITRKRAGRAFSYRDPQGRVLKERKDLARIRALAIPPAWTGVWICPHPNGHLQATGRDARGRKQYRYHDEWRTVRDAHKFDRTLVFAGALPRIRARVAADLRRHGLPREKVLATIVRLLETTLIRVGNAEYARDNKSYGLTTFRDRHVDFDGAELAFEFRGKSGKLHKVSIRDRRLARIVRACQELPGQELFQYVDAEGVRRDVDSADVNAYLQEITGEPFTAKDFRTWAGTVLASLALSEFESFDTQAAAKRNVTCAIEHVAKRLGNTVAVCRKSYIHPAILDSYLDGSLLGFLKGEVEAMLREELEGLSGEEAAVLAFLQQRLAREVDRRQRQRTQPRDLKKTLRAAVRQEAKAARPT
ncbi:MAG: DNA topoisomerase IB [Geminicoccaceae bacterium]